MPDTYGHKPSADQLLHDLTRLLVLDRVEFKVPGNIPRERVQGPMERIVGAVEEYHASEDFEPSLSPYHSDEFDMLSQAEKAARLEVQTLLDQIAETLVMPQDGQEYKNLMASIQLWGERLVAMRVQQTREERQEKLDEAIEAAS